MKNMTLSLFILVALLSALTFVGCTNKEAEVEISRLQAENETLTQAVNSLQHTLDSLNAYSDSVKKSLSKLDMGI